MGVGGNAVMEGSEEASTREAARVHRHAASAPVGEVPLVCHSMVAGRVGGGCRRWWWWWSEAVAPCRKLCFSEGHRLSAPSEGGGVAGVCTRGWASVWGGPVFSSPNASHERDTAVCCGVPVGRRPRMV